VSWAAVAALCGAAYALKLLGAIAGRRGAHGEASAGPLEVLVVPLIAGLIVVQTVGDGRHVVLDARLPALLVAGVLVWRRAPLLAVVAAAGATAALLHAAGL
jgi:branched chain amino acid efflux pump